MTETLEKRASKGSTGRSRQRGLLNKKCRMHKKLVKCRRSCLQTHVDLWTFPVKWDLGFKMPPALMGTKTLLSKLKCKLSRKWIWQLVVLNLTSNRKSSSEITIWATILLLIALKSMWDNFRKSVSIKRYSQMMQDSENASHHFSRRWTHSIWALAVLRNKSISCSRRERRTKSY